MNLVLIHIFAVFIMLTWGSFLPVKISLNEFRGAVQCKAASSTFFEKGF